MYGQKLLIYVSVYGQKLLIYVSVVQGRAPEAEPLLRSALEAHTRLLGADHPDALSSLNNVALCLIVQVRIALAESICSASVCS